MSMSATTCRSTGKTMPPPPVRRSRTHSLRLGNMQAAFTISAMKYPFCASITRPTCTGVAWRSRRMRSSCIDRL
ncbi:hypothetical protein D9M72_638200 [compost metagenome]